RRRHAGPRARPRGHPRVAGRPVARRVPPRRPRGRHRRRARRGRRAPHRLLRPLRPPRRVAADPRLRPRRVRRWGVMAAHPAPPPGARPRVPAHAWTWLQRSRPVLAEIARQLYGTTPDPGLLERLKQDYATDLFVQDLVARVVCEVAFNDRV